MLSSCQISLYAAEFFTPLDIVLILSFLVVNWFRLSRYLWYFVFFSEVHDLLQNHMDGTLKTSTLVGHLSYLIFYSK